MGQWQFMLDYPRVFEGRPKCTGTQGLETCERPFASHLIIRPRSKRSANGESEMPTRKAIIQIAAIGAALAIAFGGGYLVGVRQETSQAIAAVSRSITFAHLSGTRKELEMLSLLEKLDTEEFLANRRGMLCKIIRIKAGLAADLYQKQIELDRAWPPRAESALIASRMITLDAESAERAFKESVCFQE